MKDGIDILFYSKYQTRLWPNREDLTQKIRNFVNEAKHVPVRMLKKKYQINPKAVRTAHFNAKRRRSQSGGRKSSRGRPTTAKTSKSYNFSGNTHFAS